MTLKQTEPARVGLAEVSSNSRLESVRNQQTKPSSRIFLLVTTNQTSQMSTRVSAVPRANPLIDGGKAGHS